MKNSLEKGASHLDAILIIIFLIFVMIVTPRDKTSPASTSAGGWFSGPTFTTTGSGSTISSSSSSRTHATKRSSLSISSGNAAYAYQPYEEYVEVSNWGDEAVDITGWKLRNGKDKRTYNLGGELQRFSADIAVIPQGTLLLSPRGASVNQDVVLAPGERAIITTGRIGNTSPYTITSFKENSCTGYIESSDDYAFEPPLQGSCPDPRNEPGLTNLEASCRQFVEDLPSCRTPEFEKLDAYGQECENCINGQHLSSQCAAFIKSHFTYQGCLANHAHDADFHNSDTWRIYLGRSWEMWAENYESIELFDRFDNLMASQNY